MSGVTPARSKQYFPSSTGAPLVGGKVYVYLAGTLTASNTWQDKALTTLNTNPVILDARGECSIWLDPTLTYKFVVKDSNDVTQYTEDNVLGAGETPTITTLAVDRFSGTGAQTQFTLSVTPTSENNTMVYVSGVYIQKNAYSVSGANLTFAVAPALGTNNIEVQTINQTDYAAVSSAISTVNTNIANINTVAGISANVTTVAGVAANVTTVAGISANVTTVAGISANVTSVAGVSADVTTLAPKTSEIEILADNINNVIGAAAAARIYATSAAGLAAVANGEYFWVVSADDPEILELWWDNAGVATDTNKRMVSAEYVTDTRLVGLGGMGNSYVLGSDVTYGATTPNTSTYAATAQSMGTAAGGTSNRGFLKSVSVRLSASGTGWIEIYRPDDNSPSGWFCVHTLAVTASVAGVNTWTDSTVGWYQFPLPEGSRVHYRWTSGGTLRYVTTGTTDRYISTTAIPTAGQALSGSIADPASTHDWAVEFIITEIDVVSLADRAQDLEDGHDTRGKDLTVLRGTDDLGASDQTFGNSGLAAAGTLTNGAFIWGLPATTVPGILKSVTIPTLNPSSKAAGTVETSNLAIAKRQTDGTIEITDYFTIKLEVGTTNVLSGFDDLYLPVGSYVLLTNLISGQVQYSSDATGTAGVSGSGAISVGSTVTLSDYQNSPLFTYTLRKVATTQGQRNDAVDKALRGTDDPVRQVREIFDGTSLPERWTQVGGWTVNDGLIPPTTGAVSKYAVSPIGSVVSKKRVAAKVLITDTAAMHGLITETTNNFGGAGILVDPTNSRLALYEFSSFGGGAATLRDSVLFSTTSGFALTSGHEYLIKAEKNRFSITYSITDCNDLKTVSKTFDGASAYVMLHGKPGYLFHTTGGGGAEPFKVKWIQSDALYKRKCRTLVIGDSICEGAYLGSAVETWAQQLASDCADPKTFVMAVRAGDTTTLMRSQRLEHDLQLFQPDYVVFALGANETEAWRWLYNMRYFIALTEALGAEPILVTAGPRPAVQSVMDTINGYILNETMGRYRYIDIAMALSTGDRQTWNAAYNSGDNVHPNAAGHDACALRALADAPFLVV